MILAVPDEHPAFADDLEFVAVNDDRRRLINSQAEQIRVLFDKFRQTIFAVPVGEVRRRGVKTPVIMLTARGQLSDKVLGFKQGADDYLTKPFAMAELMARITALLRRVPPMQPADAPTHIVDSYSSGTIQVDFRRTLVKKDDRTISLSAREFKLLRYLIEHLGLTISRDELLDEVWGYHTQTNTCTGRDDGIHMWRISRFTRTIGDARLAPSYRRSVSFNRVKDPRSSEIELRPSAHHPFN